MTLTFSQPVELLVSTVVDRPSTANCTIGKLGTIRIYGNRVVRKCLQPFFVEFSWPCCFVRIWRTILRYSFGGYGCCPVLQLAQYEVMTEVV